MNKPKIENKIKTVFNVYEPLLDIMKHKLDVACLKRDAYLDLVLRCEIKLLSDEVTISNSDNAKLYIVENLKQLRLKQLNLSLSSGTVELINKVCTEKNIPRDAFINRVFLLLVVSDTIISALFSDLNDGRGAEWSWEYYWTDKSGSVSYNYEDYDYFFNSSNSLDSMEEILKKSPFWRLRFCLGCMGNKGKVNLYNYSFKKEALSELSVDYGPFRLENIIGFNTFMTDENVKQQKILDSKFHDESETDKLLSFLKKEKQQKIERIKKSSPSMEVGK